MGLVVFQAAVVGGAWLRRGGRPGSVSASLLPGCVACATHAAAQSLGVFTYQCWPEYLLCHHLNRAAVKLR